VAPLKRSKVPPKPVLYFDVLNTLVVDRGGVLTPTPYAAKFVEAVKSRFRLRLLTSLEEHVARAQLKPFKIEPEFVPYRRALGKASAIAFHEPFYWIDDDPTPADLLRLADERCSDRVITVSKRDGATEQTVKKLFATVEEHATEKEAAE
jgi:hypothetical protein